MPPVHRKTDQGTGHGCFFQKTKILLLNGTEVEIKDLVGLKEFYVYSYDFKTNKIVPGRAHDCCITRRNQPLYKIILDNDEEIIATPDQEFMLRNAHYREVKDLKTGDSMMPLYRSTIKNAWSNKKVEMKINEYKYGYEKLLQPNGIWEFTHKIVQLWKNFNYIGKMNTCHHRDFNSRNNDPRNLVSCENKKHFQYHGKNCQKQFKSGIHPFQLQENPMKFSKYIEKMKLSMQSYWHSEKFKEDIKKANRIGSTKNLERMKKNNPMKDFNTRKKMSESTKKRFEDPIQRKQISDTLKEYYEYNPTAKEKCRQGGINCWNNRQKEGWDNPMHNKDTVKKMKNSLKKYWLDSDNRKKHSEKIKLSSKKLYEERPEIKEKISTSVRATFAKKHDFVSYQQYLDIIGLFKNIFKLKFVEIEELVDVRADVISSQLKRNHKIKSIEFYGYEDVYCFTVDEHHNFALTSGIFVKNCFPPRPSATWSGDVYVNKLNVERKTDMMQSHCCPGSGCHGGVHQGAHTVFVNKLDIQTIGDPIDCGSSVAEGSGDVWVDGA